jgi:hypothetical protein
MKGLCALLKRIIDPVPGLACGAARRTCDSRVLGVALPVSMSAPIAVSATAGSTSLLFTAPISNPLLAAALVGMWAKASISPPSELAREAGEALPVEVGTLKSNN